MAPFRLQNASIATVISFLLAQSALADTYNFQFGQIGGALAVGSLTTSAQPGSSSWNINFSQLSALNVTVSGTSGGNGSFSLSDFSNIFFNGSSSVDLSRNLSGQAGLSDFNLFSSSGTAPNGFNVFILQSSTGEQMLLSCLALSTSMSACSAAQASLLQTSANSLSFGAASSLDSLRGNTNARMQSLINELDTMDGAKQRATLARITPQSNSANEQAVNEVIRSVSNSISNRMYNTRNERGLSPQLSQRTLDTSLLLADNSRYSGAGLGELAGSGKYGLWVQAFGGKTNQDQHASYSGYDANTSGVTIGADTLLDDQWVLGAAFSYGLTNIDQRDYRDGDSSQVDTYQLTAYASRDFGAWYLDGMLGYSQQKYETKRSTVIDGNAKANFDGDQLFVKVEAGYPIVLTKQLKLIPLAGLEWSHFELDGYQEKGADSLGLRVKGENVERTAGTLGARLEMQFDLAKGSTLYPFAHARWVHQFDTDGVNTTSSFLGGSSSFVTTGQKLTEDSYIAGIGVMWQQANGSSLSIQLDTEQATARSGYGALTEAKWMF